MQYTKDDITEMFADIKKHNPAILKENQFFKSLLKTFKKTGELTERQFLYLRMEHLSNKKPDCNGEI